MSKLDWNNVGERFFETGVDRGVLYSTDGVGVAWNGLIEVTESPSGGEAQSYYLDGQKFLNQGGAEEFEGTIQAYTYPKEFAAHDGSASVKGLYIHEQFRLPFGLSYRTLIGNDIEGTGYAYKIHLVYNAVALPSDAEYITQGDDTEALTFSWDFTTTPDNVKDTSGMKPLSHVSIRPDKTLSSLLEILTDTIYGTGEWVNHSIAYGTGGYGELPYGGYYRILENESSPRLPSLNELIDWFELYSKTGYGQGTYGEVPYGGNTKMGY